MASHNKRYYAWLAKAYFKRWKKTILGALVGSIFVSLALIGLVTFYVMPLFAHHAEKIGYWGVYSVDAIPSEITDKVSMGLVKVQDDGTIVPGAAKSWKIDNDREYTFYLRDDLRFHDGREFSAKTIPFNFENVNREIIDDYTIKYTLKEPYSPFLVNVSSPILLKNLAGLGEYEIEDIELNGGFVRSIAIKNTKDDLDKKTYTFYPTQEALKVAFSLGEADTAVNLTSSMLHDEYNLAQWPKVEYEESINNDNIVTIFFNTNDEVVSDKRIRQSLHYALPEETEYGKRLYSPIVESSAYFSKPPNYGIADKELAKEILDSAGGAPEKPIVIKVDPELADAARIIQKNWGEIGVKAEIEVVDRIPADFQVLLYEMKVPKDPDQYILWHSDQRSNIVGYKNLRIDKLLEDGRSVTDLESRQEIYADFQKYLMDDLPASFFYHPKVYSLYRQD